MAPWLAPRHNAAGLARDQVLLKEHVSFMSDPLGIKADIINNPRVVSDVVRVLFALSFYMFAEYLQLVSMHYVENAVQATDFYAKRWPASDSDHDPLILWDLGFRVFSYLDYTKHPLLAPNLVIITEIPIFIYIRLLVIVGPFSLRWPIMRRWFLLVPSCHLLRALCLAMTVLPDPDKYCKDTISSPNPWMAAWYSVTKTKPDMTCQDVFFSGHMVILTMVTCFWLRYECQAPLSVRMWRDRTSVLSATSLQKVVAVCIFLVASWNLIATRFHYTIDVVFGFLVTLFVFKGYHYLITVAPFRRGMLYTFLAWYEKGAPDLEAVHFETKRRLEEEAQLRERIAVELLHKFGSKAIVNSGCEDRLKSLKHYEDKDEYLAVHATNLLESGLVGIFPSTLAGEEVWNDYGSSSEDLE